MCGGSSRLLFATVCVSPCIMAPKKAPVLKSILKKPSKVKDDVVDDAADIDADVDVSPGAKPKMSIPVCLKEFLGKRQSGAIVKWDQNCAKAVLDLQKSLSRKGHPKLAEQLGSSKGEARQDLCMKLFLCKKESDLSMIEEQSVETSGEAGILRGWMNQWQIFKLTCVPINDSTERWRENFLSKLDRKDDVNSPDGNSYWFEFHKVAIMLFVMLTLH